MKFKKLLVVLMVYLLGFSGTQTKASLWITGYYPGYEQVDTLPASNIDFSALTHVIHFCLIPNTDGSLNASGDDITPEGSTDLVTRAHAAGVKVLICIGGAGSQSGFDGATTSGNLSLFVSNIVSFATNYGYDGVDIDWEPLDQSNATNFPALVTALRAALTAAGPGMLLTAATATEPTFFANLQSDFDQINIETYDMLGTSTGWYTWFNAPIYSAGFRFPSNGNLIPSADTLIKSYISAGVATNKLSIAVSFYGDVEMGGAGTSTGGATQPLQSWTNPPSVTSVRYTDIMADYYETNLYHWDTNAGAPYLSITNANEANDMFVSFDDARSCQSKVSYARNNGLGGVMIWELGQDHVASEPDALLEAVKQALAAPGPLSITPNGNNMELSFTGIALGDYNLQWNSNLNAGVWNSVLITNFSGFGGVIQITDPTVLNSQGSRYYRVKTPP